MEIPSKDSLNCSSCREISIKNKYPDFYKYLIDNYTDTEKFTERLYLYYNKTNKGTCKICGRPTKFINYKVGYAQYCSRDCAKKDSKEITKKIKETCLKRYGVDSPNKLESKKNKCKETCKQKYGVENVFQIKYIQEKSRETCKQKYGVEYPMQSKDIQGKSRETCKQKYGVEYIGQLEEFKQHNNEIRQRIIEKCKETCRQKYGVDCVLQANQIKEKTKETLIKKYGVVNPMQSVSIKNKYKESVKTHYGVDNPFKSKEIWDKIITNDTRPNLKFEKLLKENNIEYCREYYLDNYRYDFKVGNLLIEINPSITHNSTINVFGKNPLSKEYHYNKSQIALKYNYKCICIWDYDDFQDIINYILNKSHINKLQSNIINKLYNNITDAIRDFKIIFIDNSKYSNDEFSEYTVKKTFISSFQMPYKGSYIKIYDAGWSVLEKNY